jgi:RimJ/RimL family protein N-acetyltransferase
MDITPDSNYFWQTEKIRLRALRPEDAEKKCREWTDSQARSLLEYQLDLPPVSLETYRARLLDACDFKGAPDTLSFAIDSLSGEFVGWANLFVGDGRHGRFSIGMSIFQEYQRKGYAAEALRLLLHYGFDELRCHKCNTACLDTNTASIALQKKLGFVEEGRRREVIFLNGCYHDEILFGLTEHEYRQFLSAN